MPTMTHKQADRHIRNAAAIIRRAERYGVGRNADATWRAFQAHGLALNAYWLSANETDATARQYARWCEIERRAMAVL